MHAIDITRHHFQPAKHYSGLLHYQGSVLLDSEQNEEALIQQSEGRRVLTDLLVTSGSPDDGMKIGPLSPAPANYDFAIGAGVFFLGGMRLDVERAERFLLQSEHLQQRALTPPMDNDWLTDGQSAVPAAPPAAARTDLVWLEAYEQAVTQTEDSECLETGLGVESSARIRPMRKVHLFAGNSAQDCGAAFDNLVTSLETGGRFTFDAKTAELKSNRRLTVDFVDVGPDPDPCSPPIRRGFLGADNETIQIRVIGPDRFVWSFGNAAPLYRQTRNGNVVTFAAHPRDELMRPLVGDLIEIIRCDALLPNGELIGERHGIFHRVVTAYNPANRTVEISPAINAVNNTNDVTHAAALATAWGIGAPGQYLFARVWRGEAMNADPIGKTTSPAPGVQLGSTGVRVSFSGNGPVGDSWTFSVRPNTPEVIVPWEMRRGAPPTAPRRYITALGLIKWGTVANAAPIFVDCRRHVRKLENASGCCEVTVGDGTESFGDVATIADALARLPASGGKICLLRGTHVANVLIANRANITIEGCGPLTRLQPAPGSGGIPVISIVDSTDIAIRHFAILAPEEIAIAIDDLAQGNFGLAARNIDIRSMHILFRDAPAIFFNGGEGLKVEQCNLLFVRIRQLPQNATSNAGMSSSIVLLGRDMLVERCRIDAAPLEDQDRSQIPLGGIHVVGGSERVEIRRNRIAEGGGIGIVLGSVHYAPASDPSQPTRLEPATKVPWKDYGRQAGASGNAQPSAVVIGYIVSEDGCFLIPVGPEDPPEGEDPPLPNADPLIIDLRIIENDIENMGSSGIAPFMQFDLSKDRQLCGVSGLIIRNNRIIACVRGEAPALTGGQFIYTARGGIVLGWAENLELVGNHVERCGASRPNPICGVFAVGLAHARISENRIHDNGMRLLDERAAVMLGQRGGIVIRYVQPSVPGLGLAEQPIVTTHVVAPQIRMQSGGEALLLHENQVSAPEGRALEINGVGAMSINDNQLTSLGASAASLLWLVLSAGAASAPGQAEMFALDPYPAIMGNAVVSVLNFGLSNDIANLPFGFGNVLGVSAGGDVTPGVGAITTGRLLFANNQTRYDGLAAAPTLVPCLVGLASIDDAKMVGNQCDADFVRGTRDFAFTHGLVIGFTMQMSNNRFSEPSVNSDGVGQLSGLCLGMSVLMHHNFGSHCFLGLPSSPQRSLLDPNRSMVLHCERRAQPTLNLFGDMLGGANRVRNVRSPEATIDERYTYRRSPHHG